MAEGILNPIPQLEADFDFDVYTKQEVDTLLDGKADKVDTYTKTEADALLNEKAGKSTTLAGYGITDAYTKAQTDNLLNGKADTNSVYTKEETDNLLSVKANSADVYTKTEANNLLSAKADSVNVYTKIEADTLLAGKADTDDVYTKTEIDNRLTVTKDGTWVKGTQTTATNLEKLEGGIEYLYGLLSYKYSQLRKYINGNYYDYETDTDSAYTKTVPAGAMPYAGLEKLGGKTVVWNQLVQDPNMTDATKWSTDTIPANFSFSVSSNTLKVERLAGTNNFVLVSKPNTTKRTANHKFLYSFTLRGDVARSIRFYYGSGTDTIGATTTFEHYSGICTPTTGGGDIGISVLASQMDVGGYIEVQNYCIFDLTLMFGSGNEPTTVEEFKAMFPADYYEYNAGTLLSAGVTEVVSKGKNLADYSGGQGYPSDTASSTATKRIYEVGKWVKDIAFSNGYTSGRVSVTVGANSISVSTATAGYGVGIPFICEDNTSYSFSFIPQNSTLCAVMWYAKDGSYISNNLIYSPTSSGYTYTSPANATQGVLLLTTNQSNVQCSFTNIQIEKSATATTYSPYKKITYPIPAEIQALEGYGWSAGTVYNYIDYERKVFVKNVGKLDLGSTEATWYYNTVQNFFSCVINGMNSTTTTNAIVQGYTLKSVSTGWLGMVDYEFGISAGSLRLHNSAYTTSEAFKQTLVGKYAYYELAEPIETDISAYISDDNLIEVESGGTLTFPNSNGDNYRIPVPSTEEYMINLQEAVSNG